MKKKGRFWRSLGFALLLLSLTMLLLLPALWLHVFLAYPSGRLTGRPERFVVAAGYAYVSVRPGRAAVRRCP